MFEMGFKCYRMSLTPEQRSHMILQNGLTTEQKSQVIEFSYFKFKIRLIRLGFSFRKQKVLFLNSQPTDSQSGIINITPKSQL